MPSPHTNKAKQAQPSRPQSGPQTPPHQASQAASPEVVALYAQLVRRDMYPAYMCGVHQQGIMADVPLGAYRQYVEDYVLDATGSDCAKQPILRTLIEQLLLLHQTIGRLHGDGANAADMETRRVNLQLAAQLTGELRRLSEEIEKMVQMRRKTLLPFPAAEAEKSGGGKNKVGSKVGAA